MNNSHPKGLNVPNHDPQAEGFACRDCGHEMRVRRTIKLTGLIARERACVKCGNPTSTVERETTEYLRAEIKAVVGEVLATSR